MSLSLQEKEIEKSIKFEEEIKKKRKLSEV